MSVRFHSKLNGIHHNSTPLFNKRMFKAQAGIVLTEEVLHVLNRPSTNPRSKADLHKLKCVVNGLKEIHKGFQFIKDALAFVIRYEKVESYIEVKKKPSEKDLSCYYILTGSIEATYNMNTTELGEGQRERLESSERNNKDNSGCVITYTHIAGDYLGLVSGDGEEYDLPPPHSIKTMEVCEFLRIDRIKFHQAVRTVHNQYVQEVEHFINSESILRYLPEKEREKLVPLMAKQEYGAGKVIVNQGEVPDHIFFIGKGRCQFFRRVFIREANRVELVKLGQIEKGEVFGESSVLDGSPSFCSVTSIGQVTCFLINKWVIKTNEHVVNLLREHRHYFYEDEMIQRYIRDSDIWHSYKRSKIVELLEATNKQLIVVEKKDVQEVLGTAIDFGNAKRLHSAQALQQREVGEPEPQEALFIVPRSRRRSSAILHSNAAAVVKAVLLLRRNTDDNKSEIRLPAIKAKSQKIKPVSAPSSRRYRSRALSPLHSTKDYQTVKDGQKEMWTRHKSGKCLPNSRPKTVSVMERPINIISTKSRPNSRGKGQNNSKKNKSETKARTKILRKKNENTSKEEFHAEIKRATSNMDTRSQESGSIQRVGQSEHGIEKCVSSRRNFIIKEIINTGSSRRQSQPSRYQRFDKSMFAILDTEEGDPKRSAPTPWGVTFAASKWMAGIRKRRMRKEVDGMTPSPTPPPLIVIEEYAPQSAPSDDQSSDEECPTKTMGIRKTPSPSLEQLQEEKDEEIAEYNKLEAGQSVENKWYTAIHEARDESNSHLEQLKIDLDILKKDRDRIKVSGPEKEVIILADHKSIGDKEPDKPTTGHQTEQIDGGSMPSQRKFSTRSRTLSRSTTVDSQTFSSSRSRKCSRNQRDICSSHHPNPNTNIATTTFNDIKIAIKARHERRRLLLLEKIGL